MAEIDFLVWKLFEFVKISNKIHCTEHFFLAVFKNSFSIFIISRSLKSNQFWHEVIRRAWAWMRWRLLGSSLRFEWCLDRNPSRSSPSWRHRHARTLEEVCQKSIRYARQYFSISQHRRHRRPENDSPLFRGLRRGEVMVWRHQFNEACFLYYRSSFSLLFYYSQGQSCVLHKSVGHEYESASEPLHISVKYVLLNWDLLCTVV